MFYIKEIRYLSAVLLKGWIGLTYQKITEGIMEKLEYHCHFI